MFQPKIASLTSIYTNYILNRRGPIAEFWRTACHKLLSSVVSKQKVIASLCPNRPSNATYSENERAIYRFIASTMLSRLFQQSRSPWRGRQTKSLRPPQSGKFSKTGQFWSRTSRSSLVSVGIVSHTTTIIINRRMVWLCVFDFGFFITSMHSFVSSMNHTDNIYVCLVSIEMLSAQRGAPSNLTQVPRVVL